MHTDTVRGVTGAVTESESGVCLALLVQGNWGIEMLHRNLLVMERTNTDTCIYNMGRKEPYPWTYVLYMCCYTDWCAGWVSTDTYL